MMKKLTFLVIITLITVGCSQKDVVNFDENTTLVIQKQVSSVSEFDYEVINSNEDKETIQKVIDIFKSVKWQTNIEIDMIRNPDYKLNENYHIWISPQRDRLEIINRNNSYYARLSESDSSALYILLTGNELNSH